MLLLLLLLHIVYADAQWPIKCLCDFKCFCNFSQCRLYQCNASYDRRHLAIWNAGSVCTWRCSILSPLTFASCLINIWLWATTTKWTDLHNHMIQVVCFVFRQFIFIRLCSFVFFNGAHERRLADVWLVVRSPFHFSWNWVNIFLNICCLSLFIR